MISPIVGTLEKTKALMFANDTNLVCHRQSAVDIESKLNRNMENIHNYLIANKFTLNKGKTGYVLAGRRQRLNQISETLDVIISNQAIKQLFDEKVLGR